MTPSTPPSDALKALNLLRIVAIIDFLLLIPLLYSASFFADHHSVVQILGPVHGIGFVGMLYLTAKGAGEEHWGWWFPLLVVVTAGPIGSLIGDLKVRKDLEAAAAATS